VSSRAPGSGEHTSHASNCVCAACLALKPAPTLNEALHTERTRSDSILRLDSYQRSLLNTFTKRWNADRAARGRAPVLAHDALTQGLESLIAMIGQE